MSRLIKATSGFTKVRERRDIFEKYAQTLGNAWKKPDLLIRTANREERDQIEADHLGLLMQVAAGYDPSAQIRALDRLMGTRGRTGNFLSHIFNFEPNQKRLGELLKNLPPACALGPPSPAQLFLARRKTVLGVTAVHFTESLAGSSLVSLCGRR